MFDKIFAIFVIAIIVSIVFMILSVFNSVVQQSAFPSNSKAIVNHIDTSIATIYYYALDVVVFVIIIGDIIVSALFPNIFMGITDLFFFIGFGYIWLNIRYAFTQIPIFLSPIVQLFSSTIFMIFVEVMLVLSIILNFRVRIYEE